MSKIRKKPNKKKKKNHFKTGAYTSIKSGEIFKFRSGWEHLLMIYLDNDSTVMSWSYETIEIRYTSNKKTQRQRRYIPDFFVIMRDGRRRLIEIKQMRKLNNRITLLKTNAAIGWCNENNATYELITEIELKALGLLQREKSV